jgi:hypothetical protein
VDEHAVSLGLAGQVVLGQRRALIGQVDLFPDKRELSVEAAAAKRLRRLGAG